MAKLMVGLRDSFVSFFKEEDRREGRIKKKR